jgi:peptide deformylase
MPLEIVQAGDPVLRQPSRFLTAEEIRSREIQQLIEEMREAMRSAPGVGLAAPQAGHPLQLAVIEDRADYHQKLTANQLAERERRFHFRC